MNAGAQWLGADEMDAARAESRRRRIRFRRRREECPANRSTRPLPQAVLTSQARARPLSQVVLTRPTLPRPLPQAVLTRPARAHPLSEVVLTRRQSIRRLGVPVVGMNRIRKELTQKERLFWQRVRLRPTLLKCLQRVRRRG